MTQLKIRPHAKLFSVLGIPSAILFSVILIIGAYILSFERNYTNKIYPNVSIQSTPVGGKTIQEVLDMLSPYNTPLSDTQFVFALDAADEPIATVSALQLSPGYDTNIAATQAYLIGRSPYFLSNIREKFFSKTITIPLSITWNAEEFDALVQSLQPQVEIPVQDALFTFENGKVSAFKASLDGKGLDKDELTKRFEQAIKEALRKQSKEITILIPTVTIKPAVTTDKANSFGIREKIGTGFSMFSGSIPGRIHNVALGSSRLNGVIIRPGETFSFNQAIGDVSAATGYQPAYIIKDGRTVLGDGGGMCQVSTTLFRAALNAGLPITERHEHSYRVHYYEEGGFKPGLDATVFSPTEDLKFTNNTPASILIQTTVDTENLTATFDLYGTSDGRKAEIYDHQVWGIVPPPPPLYQDDPTLPVGTIRQVDFDSWGAKASFKYKVTRGTEIMTQQDFFSNYRPWQAVFLKGTKQ